MRLFLNEFWIRYAPNTLNECKSEVEVGVTLAGEFHLLTMDQFTYVVFYTLKNKVLKLIYLSI